MWYDTLTGQFVPLLGWSSGDGYRSREPNGYLNFVRDSDAEVCEAFVPSEELGKWPYAKDRVEPAAARKIRMVGWQAASEARAKQIIQELETERVNALPWLSHKATSYTPRPIPSPTPSAGQSTKLSSYEATANMVLGFAISLGITAVVFPELPLLHNVGITSVFAVASWLRSYALRRIFNHYAVKGLS